MYREKKFLDDVKNDEVTRKYLTNCFQNFIHSVNHLSRNSVESPFTNVSIFDRPKLEMFMTEDNMGWYYESIPEEIKDKFNGDREAFKSYVIDMIMELQEIFMDFFEKGDVLFGGRPFRFPVS